MARANSDAPVDVTEDSATSDQATPMAEAPANPTEAQQAEGAQTEDAQAGTAADEGPSKEAVEQVRKDADERAENPNKPVMREANPAVGGESFSYLQR